jgi:hypothetical protein
MSHEFSFGGDMYYKLATDDPNVHRVIVVPKKSRWPVRVIDVPKHRARTATQLPAEVATGLAF